MHQTIAEKIISQHCGKEAKAGEIVIADVDFAIAQDGTAPLAIQVFKKMGQKKVFAPDKIAFFIDHSAPSPNKDVSSLHKLMREFAREQNIKLFDIGEGVCHVVTTEEGYVTPGTLVVGADSHTCSYGALNSFATGIGSTDFAAVMASGKIWLRVPESIKVILRGKIPDGVYSKDIVLYLMGKITSRGAVYKSVEFEGEVIENLSIEARFTISNMAVEMGAKAGIMQFDEKTEKWLKGKAKRRINPVKADPGAVYEKILEYDISEISPQVACPHTVDNVVPVEKVEGTPINQAFLGTCTNGRLEDLKIAASILEGKKIHP
ncbi:3-isopropylmalate dehydratase large subunit, partial [Candidatus Aerophobetes bacterium]|nr:3-isopropylmalate dehydratase large subunit [Candidatus Aerophobetes bacterium]